MSTKSEINVYGVGHAEERRSPCRLLVGKPKERDHMKDLDVDGKIILKWYLEN
jgi:hypothetical protein